MPVRRVNSTGRVRIPRDAARIRLHREPDGALIFDCSLELDGYDLPDDAGMVLEAYRQTSLMRFDLGTVGAPSALPRDARRLSEFSGPEGLRFRIKVVARNGQAGMLVGECDRLSAADAEPSDEKRLPLLPPEPGALGQEVWRVDVSGAAGPRLIVNEGLRDWKNTVASPAFRSLVYPAAMRQVLIHVTNESRTRDIDDESDWRCLWLQFACGLPGVGSMPDAEDDDDAWEIWVDSAVEAFARLHRFLDRLDEAGGGDPEP